MTKTAPTPAPPIVLAGRLPGDYRTATNAQFWGETTVAGITSAACLVSIEGTSRGVRMLLHEQMPAEWLPAVLETYALLGKGELPVPTHDVDWVFSQPVFSPVAA